jgi:hypothetical protein
VDPFKPYEPRARKPVAARMTQDGAEALALKALTHVLADQDLLERFVQLTGCGADDIKARLGEAAFLGAVLDFLLGDDAATIAFAESEKIPPEAPMLARGLLP